MPMLWVFYLVKKGMEVTAFTTKTKNFDELRLIGVSHVQSSIDLESLKSNEGKYDLVINTLFLDNEEIYKSYQHLTAPGGVYVMLGLPSITTEFKIDLDYMIRNEITTAGSIVGSIKDVKEMLEFSHNHNIECYTETYTFDKFN
jgi:D-arabinose 1-dehydrogenase-like Zn-dependent alcohol dehydrogenase